jgi:diadenylate cyclase
MIQELTKPQTWAEILILAVAFYFILNFVRGTRGAGILKGIVFLFIVTFLGALFLAERFHLENIQRMLTWILSGSAIAIIVLFAPELRRGLSHLAQTRILSPFLRSQSSGIIDELANAAVKLSKNRIGALVAIERDVGLGEYVEHGCRIDAALTSELLESLFYPGSALHDGAVIVQHDRVAAAGCLLPLTDDTSLSKSMGTRHRAAIGISEETDAIALVVSEETGRISIAVKGKLTGDLTRESLEKLLTELYSRGDRPTLGIRKAKPGEGPDAGTVPKNPAPASGDGNGSAKEPGSAEKPAKDPPTTEGREGGTEPDAGKDTAAAAFARAAAELAESERPVVKEKKSESKKREKKSTESSIGEEKTA